MAEDHAVLLKSVKKSKLKAASFQGSVPNCDPTDTQQWQCLFYARPAASKKSAAVKSSSDDENIPARTRKVTTSIGERNRRLKMSWSWTLRVTLIHPPLFCLSRGGRPRSRRLQSGPKRWGSAYRTHLSGGQCCHSLWLLQIGTWCSSVSVLKQPYGTIKTPLMQFIDDDDDDDKYDKWRHV